MQHIHIAEYILQNCSYAQIVKVQTTIVKVFQRTYYYNILNSVKP